MVFYVIGRSWWQLTFKGRRSPLLERIGWTAFLSFGFGVFGLWIPEHVIFDCDHPIKALPLHAGWHITSTIGGYGWVLWAIADHKRLQQDEIRLCWRGTGLFGSMMQVFGRLLVALVLHGAVLGAAWMLNGGSTWRIGQYCSLQAVAFWPCNGWFSFPRPC